jgi:hypothetical protein
MAKIKDINHALLRTSLPRRRCPGPFSQMMKKTVIITTVVIIAAFGACLIVAGRSLDGTKAWFISRLPGFEDSTVYAPCYSEQAFRSVSEGMTTQELVRVLGHPFHVWPAPPPPENRVQCMNWSYTKSSMQEDINRRAKDSFNLRIRTVGIYDGKVAYKSHRLAQDADYSFQ